MRRPLLLTAYLERMREKLRPAEQTTPGSHQEIFHDIFRRGLWANPETVSGPGSTRERAAAFRGDLMTLLAQFGARVVLDAGCGDFNWMADVVDSVESYVGIDVVPDLIARDIREHGRAGRTFLCCDITSDPLPRADVILCRDCLVHFSLADAQAAIGNFVRSGSAYLLTTTFLDTRQNTEIQTGGWRELNLQQPPFLFPAPLALVDERCLHSGGRYRSKRLALWAVEALRPQSRAV
jgi:SAM-dependent methyltransferase